MPSSWSTSLRFELQFTGEKINLWGDALNTVLQHADYSIAGWLNKTLADADYSLTTANAGDDEARAAMIKFTGTLTQNRTITIPAVSKSYYVFNNTGKVLTFTTGAGDTVSVDAGDKTVIQCDGAGVHTISFGGLGLKDFIASVTATAGAVPGVTGNAGKYVYTDGAGAFWRQVQSADIGDFDAEVRRKVLVYSLIFGGA